jgi:hypothetical protein
MEEVSPPAGALMWSKVRQRNLNGGEISPNLKADVGWGGELRAKFTHLSLVLAPSVRNERGMEWISG